MADDVLHQLKEIIREQCASREPGQLIPSELELCQMYSVSRTTVRKALDHLTQEGLLYRIQGKGTFVAPPKLRERFVHQTPGIYEDMASRGVTIRTQVLEVEGHRTVAWNRTACFLQSPGQETTFLLFPRKGTLVE